jgi:PQQ-dependent catabolism-associated CXXCW motif protein
MNNRIHAHRRAAATLFVALLAVVHAVPALAQGSTMPPLAGAQPVRNASLDGQTAWERRDMGVAAPRDLHDGAFHAPTPNQIPGGQVITTKGLLPLLQQGMQVHVFDVLGGPESLPNAISAAWAAQPGSFDDATQQQMAQMLSQVTGGQTDAPLVFYCLSAECWMSYNAALRAIRLGYRNVLWYRGGIEAWKSAGLPFGRGVQGQQPPAQPLGATRPPGALPPEAFGSSGGRS